MTEQPADPQEIARLKARIESLEEMMRWNLFVLNLLGTMGDYCEDTHKDPAVIFQSACRFLRRLLDFRTLAFYTIDESDSSFVLKHCEPADEQELIQKKVDRQIDNGIFAWSLNQNRPVLVNDDITGQKLVLHVLATNIRISGMFVGEMVSEVLPCHDNLDLLSIAIHYTSHALEGAFTYSLLGEKNRGLEEIIEQRMMDLKKQAAQLQSEVIERTHAEKVSQEKETRIRVIINSAADGIITIDENCIVESFNPAAERLFGYTVSEIIGKNISLVIPEPHKSEHDEHIRNYLRTGQGKIIGKGPREVSGLRKDGTGLPIDLTVSEILLEDRRLFLGVLRDISERKRTEEELEKYRNHLQNLVEERTAELKITHEQLLHSEKLSSLGKLTASISHEFNNPLFGVRNIVEQALAEEGQNEEIKDLLRLAIKECDRMANMIRKLQNFYKPGTETRELIDVHQIIDEMLLLLKKELQVRKVILQKYYDPTLLKIVAVEDQLKQVFLNLLQNAADAISESGTITVVTEMCNTFVKVMVRDSGEGIPEENIKKIFEPYFTTKSSKGTGLGLSVCYGIIKSHGGEISVESRLGAGTVFTIILPVKHEADYE